MDSVVAKLPLSKCLALSFLILTLMKRKSTFLFGLRKGNHITFEKLYILIIKFEN